MWPGEGRSSCRTTMMRGLAAATGNVPPQGRYGHGRSARGLREDAPRLRAPIVDNNGTARPGGMPQLAERVWEHAERAIRRRGARSRHDDQLILVRGWTTKRVDSGRRCSALRRPLSGFPIVDRGIPCGVIPLAGSRGLRRPRAITHLRNESNYAECNFGEVLDRRRRPLCKGG